MNDQIERVLAEHSIGAFNPSQSACSRCRTWMTHAEYRQHLADALLAAGIGDVAAGRRYCGCAWCCSKVPPESRGETHKRTCSPRADQTAAHPDQAGRETGRADG